MQRAADASGRAFGVKRAGLVLSIQGHGEDGLQRDLRVRRVDGGDTGKERIDENDARHRAASQARAKLVRGQRREVG